MSTLVWDAIGDRRYESGIDRGVLYLPDGSGVPWNGLTAVTEKTEKEVSSVYYDGVKISDLAYAGDFVGTLNAITYPDEFVELEGYGELRGGVFVGEQRPQMFGLCYRTKLGTDLDADAGYKLHILYNVLAIPSDKTYDTLTDSSTSTEFEWNITAIPEEIPGFRPTAHIILSSKDINPTLLSDIEDLLYGTESTAPTLLPIADLVDYISDWVASISVTDNGDGTWSLTTNIPGVIVDNGDGSFQLNNVNATYLDADTYELSDT